MLNRFAKSMISRIFSLSVMLFGNLGNQTHSPGAGNGDGNSAYREGRSLCQVACELKQIEREAGEYNKQKAGARFLLTPPPCGKFESVCAFSKD